MPTPPPPATARPAPKPTAAALLCVTVALVGWVSFHYARVPHTAAPRTDGPIYRVDVNAARVADLLHLPEVGPAKAEAILAERTARGPFAGPDDLRRVKGIGAKLPERLAGYLRFEN